jgi:hypothetical protein
VSIAENFAWMPADELRQLRSDVEFGRVSIPVFAVIVRAG